MCSVMINIDMIKYRSFNLKTIIEIWGISGIIWW
jgi:hypothetical protein